MPIKAELMLPHEWKGVEEHFDTLPILAKQLAMTAQWFKELVEQQAKEIEMLKKNDPKERSERYFQAREVQRKELERMFP